MRSSSLLVQSHGLLVRVSGMTFLESHNPVGHGTSKPAQCHRDDFVGHVPQGNPYRAAFGGRGVIMAV